jgi:hypothetical protein
MGNMRKHRKNAMDIFIIEMDDILLVIIPDICYILRLALTMFGEMRRFINFQGGIG